MTILADTSFFSRFDQVNKTPSFAIKILFFESKNGYSF